MIKKYDEDLIKKVIDRILEENKNDLDDLTETSDVVGELYEVIDRLLNSSGEINLKTEINHPKNLAILTVVENYASQIKLKKVPDTLNLFQKQYLKNMVSYKRGSRNEVVTILKSKKEEMKETDEFVD